MRSLLFFVLSSTLCFGLIRAQITVFSENDCEGNSQEVYSDWSMCGQDPILSVLVPANMRIKLADDCMSIEMNPHPALVITPTDVGMVCVNLDNPMSPSAVVVLDDFQFCYELYNQALQSCFEDPCGINCLTRMDLFQSYQDFCVSMDPVYEPYIQPPVFKRSIDSVVSKVKNAVTRSALHARQHRGGRGHGGRGPHDHQPTQYQPPQDQPPQDQPPQDQPPQDQPPQDQPPQDQPPQDQPPQEPPHVNPYPQIDPIPVDPPVIDPLPPVIDPCPPPPPDDGEYTSPEDPDNGDNGDNGDETYGPIDDGGLIPVDPLPSDWFALMGSLSSVVSQECMPESPTSLFAFTFAQKLDVIADATKVCACSGYTLDVIDPFEPSEPSPSTTPKPTKEKHNRTRPVLHFVAFVSVSSCALVLLACCRRRFRRNVTTAVAAQIAMPVDAVVMVGRPVSYTVVPVVSFADSKTQPPQAHAKNIQQARAVFAPPMTKAAQEQCDRELAQRIAREEYTQ